MNDGTFIRPTMVGRLAFGRVTGTNGPVKCRQHAVSSSNVHVKRGAAGLALLLRQTGWRSMRQLCWRVAYGSGRADKRAGLPPTSPPLVEWYEL